MIDPPRVDQRSHGRRAERYLAVNLPLARPTPPLMAMKAFLGSSAAETRESIPLCEIGCAK